MTGRLCLDKGLSPEHIRHLIITLALSKKEKP